MILINGREEEYLVRRCTSTSGCKRGDRLHERISKETAKRAVVVPTGRCVHSLYACSHLRHSAAKLFLCKSALEVSLLGFAKTMYRSIRCVKSLCGLALANNDGTVRLWLHATETSSISLCERGVPDPVPSCKDLHTAVMEQNIT